jgi:hypothetical protein
MHEFMQNNVIYSVIIKKIFLFIRGIVYTVYLFTMPQYETTSIV